MNNKLTIRKKKEVPFIMSSGRNPNRAQKQLLVKNKKDWNEWLLIKTLVENKITMYQFRHKTTNEVIYIDVNGTMVSK